jgi:hypothetical protein
VLDSLDIELDIETMAKGKAIIESIVEARTIPITAESSIASVVFLEFVLENW